MIYSISNVNTNACRYKVAVLLSGHARSITVTKNKILSIFRDEIGADFFLHTWSEQEMRESTWRKPENSNIKPLDVGVIKLINPDDYLVEAQDEIAIPPSVANSIDALPPALQASARGFWWMFYGIGKAYELCIKNAVKNNKSYDVIIRYRLDEESDSTINIVKDINKALCSRGIIMPAHDWAWPFGVFSDVYWVATAEDFSFASALIWDNCANYIARFAIYKKFIPELLITKILRDNNLKILPSSGIHAIVRQDGSRYYITNCMRKGFKNRWLEMLSCWSLMTEIDMNNNANSPNRKSGLLHSAWREYGVWPLRYYVCMIFLVKIAKVREIISRQMGRWRSKKTA